MAAGHVHGATSGRLLWVSLALTLAFVTAETALGLRARSLALLSDAGHNVSDALALGLAAYAIWVARRPATPGKTFGYHRVAILSALANALTLVVIAVLILAQAARSLRHPELPNGVTMMAVAAVAVVMNTVIAYWLRGDGAHSLNVRAAYVHMAGDALSSLGVVLAGLVVHFTGWPYADTLASCLIAAFILFSSWGIIRDAVNVLLEGTPKGLDVNALVDAIRATAPVEDVHDLHLWTVGDGLHFLSCHIVLPEACTMAQSASAVAVLNARLHDDFGIRHATIQTEAAGCDPCRQDSDALLCGSLEVHAPGCAHG